VIGQIIVRTGETARCVWPEGTFLQGGSTLAVEVRGKTFVEAFPPGGGFFRGDAPTVAEAEMRCWEQYQRSVACPAHDWDARGYTNGGAFCRLCGVFGSRVFTGEDLGQFCHACGVGTTWGRYSLNAYWDPAASFTGVVNPGPVNEHVWFCREHAPCRVQYEARLSALSAPVDDEVLADVLTRLGGGKDATQGSAAEKPAEGDPSV
jgi:hypothetical protein